MILGAVLGGGIQVALLRRTERRELRVAKRPLDDELQIAQFVFEARAAAGTEPYGFTIAGQLKNFELEQIWATHRAALAADLDHESWRRVMKQVRLLWMHSRGQEPAVEECQKQAKELEGARLLLRE